jgi:hypothetical protein
MTERARARSGTELEFGDVVYCRYKDHVLFHQADPLPLKPQLREAVGWLVHQTPEYVIITWDRKADPPTLKNGDPKASGLVLMRGDILELRKVS